MFYFTAPQQHRLAGIETVKTSVGVAGEALME